MPRAPEKECPLGWVCVWVWVWVWAPPLNLSYMSLSSVTVRNGLRTMTGQKGVDARWIGTGVPDYMTSSGVNCNDLVYAYLQTFVQEKGKWDRDWAAEGFDVVYK
ncbi:hypothetical protein EDC01DRAFT_628913 [Geopyxis carbonaria]|nr:hypothetical protein EDC01DRAFT_628913 [Geopyxis carbonaria]